LKQVYFEQVRTATEIVEIMRKKATKQIAQMLLACAEEPPETAFQVQIQVRKWLTRVSRVWAMGSVVSEQFYAISDVMAVAKKAQIVAQGTREAIMEMEIVFAQIEVFQVETVDREATGKARAARKAVRKAEKELKGIHSEGKEVKKARETAIKETKAMTEAKKAVNWSMSKKEEVETKKKIREAKEKDRKAVEAKAAAVKKARRAKEAKVVGIYMFVLVHQNAMENGSIIVIDSACQVKATIPVGKWSEQYWCHCIAITPNGSRAYMAHEDGVTMMNIVTGETLNITTRKSARHIAITPDGSQIYVAYEDFVIVIDTDTQEESNTIDIKNSRYIAIAPDGSWAYVAFEHGIVLVSIVIINIMSNDDVIEVKDPWHIAVTPDGNWAYVACGDGIRMVDTTNRQVSNIIVSPPARNNPFLHGYSIAITPDGIVYVTSNGEDISIIDTSAQQVTSERGPCGCGGIAITPDGSRVYMALENDVIIFDGNKNVINSISLNESSPSLRGYGIAIALNGSQIYVARKNFIIVIDAVTQKVVNTIPVEGFPTVVAIASIILQ
jgi:DNA-binding beta-propeller fold protein YncE